MTLVAVINDTHWGARGDKEIISDYFSRFYDEVFFPTLEEKKITQVYHLGDLVDRRTTINFKSLAIMRKVFLDRLSSYDTVYLTGNHDLYYKNRVVPNAIEELVFGGSTRARAVQHSRPHDDGQIAWIPWICDETYDDTMKILENSNSKFCLGHLELINFEMSPGIFAKHGLDHSLFNRFDRVLSGHYHKKSTYNNINYLGAPYEMYWSDYNDTKGFHLFDTETGELTHVPNPFRLFDKVVYDDSNWQSDDVSNFDFDQYKNKCLKVIIRNRTNNYWYDHFLESLNKVGAYEIRVVEDHLNLFLEPDDEIISQAEDTRTILRRAVDVLETNVDKDRLHNIIEELYQEASLVRL